MKEYLPKAFPSSCEMLHRGKDTGRVAAAVLCFMANTCGAWQCGDGQCVAQAQHMCTCVAAVPPASMLPLHSRQASLHARRSPCSPHASKHSSPSFTCTYPTQWHITCHSQPDPPVSLFPFLILFLLPCHRMRWWLRCHCPRAVGGSLG